MSRRRHRYGPENVVRLLWLSLLFGALSSTYSCKAPAAKSGGTGGKLPKTAEVPGIGTRPSVGGGPSNSGQVVATATSTNNVAPETLTPEPVADEPIHYPKLNYYGTGTMFYQNSKYPLTREINVFLDSGLFTADILSFHSSNGSVDKSIKTNIGKALYTRVTKEQFAALGKAATEQQKAQPLTFALYATKILSATGDTFNFSNPVPFFIMPKKASRYSSLDTAAYTSTSQVTALVRNVPKAFTVKVTISKMPSNVPDQTLIHVKMNIPEDDDAKIGKEKGALYGAIPLDAETTYTVDNKSEIVTNLSTTTYFQDKNARQRIGLEYKICNLTQGATSTDFSCKPSKMK